MNPDNKDLPKILENLKAGKSALAGISEDASEGAPINENPPEQKKK